MARILSCLLLVVITQTVYAGLTRNTANSGTNEVDLAAEVRNAFNFILLSSTTSKPVTTLTPKIVSGPPSNTATEKVEPKGTETTPEGSQDPMETSPFAFITIFDTTVDNLEVTENPYDHEATQPESRDIPTTAVENPVTEHISTPESTTSYRRPTTRKSVPTRKSTMTRPLVTSLPSSTSGNDGANKVYEMKNTGIKFIHLPSATRQHVTNSTTTRKTESPKPTPSELTTEYPLFEVTENEYEYMTTDDTNDSFVLVGVPAVLPNDIAAGSAVAIWIANFPYYEYFKSPAKFWAKYWYIILIVLILLILFFIIPGCLCQIYLSKHRNRRRCGRYKLALRRQIRRYCVCREKSTVITAENKDIEIGNVENEYDVPAKDEFTSSSNSAASPSSAGASTERNAQTTARIPSAASSSALSPDRSLPESGIHMQVLENKPLKDSSENATVIVIPDPLEKVHITSLSHSDTESGLDTPSKQRSYEFPEPVNDEDHSVPITEDLLQSVLSRSDNGLDIGNETIIKSNPLEKHSPNANTSPPIRPPKPAHMIPKALGPDVAPGGRPRRNKDKVRKKADREKSKEKSKNAQKERTSDRKQKTNEGRKAQKRGHTPRKDDAKGRQHKKNKTDSTTDSLMQAARSLEDILEAITKLTREYPVPKLAEDMNLEGAPRPVQKKKQDAKNRQDRKKTKKKEEKSSHPERKSQRPKGEQPRKSPEEAEREMYRTKLDRTENWASEQRKIEKSRERKKRQVEKEKDRKRSKTRESSSKRKRREKRDKGSKQKEAKEEKMSTATEPEKIPTLVKEELTPVNKTRQERSRMRLERDLKKLQRYHNSHSNKLDDGENQME